MKLIVPLSLLAFGAGTVAVIVCRPPDTAPGGAATHSRSALVGNPEKFSALYDAWKAGEARSGNGARIELGLRWSRALSTERTTASGRVELDAARNRVDVDVSGLDPAQGFEAWLVDDDPRTSAAPDANDRLLSLGELAHQDGSARLCVDLAARGIDAFDVDMVVVTRAGERPDENVLLVGMPNVFQRLRSREQGGAREPSGLLLGLVAPVAPVAPAPVAPAMLADLVAYGEMLFFNETFGGNGRTCGTCHPAENNFTIEPAFIATLPPNDPLFVAEFDPNLDFNQNGGLRFENPILMRQFGVIVENLDGFDDLRYRFTMRSVQHTLGLTQTITSPDGPYVPPLERTGWSGDGAPGNGTLREFALGAVKQHFPRTLARVAGSDFVFPTNDELDAMEAFQLSLGRQEELDLSTLSLRDPGAAAGQIAFQNNSCTRCHENAGANRGGANHNFATGVDAFARHNPDGTGELRPPDGGKGTDGSGGTGSVTATPEPDDPTVFSFGDKTFNTQSLVEFADTVPGFHNNITNMGALADTVEGAVSFYRSSEFATSPDGFTISFNGTDIDDIGKFLRVINALENRRSADAYGKRAAILISNGGYSQADLERLLDLAIAECNDGIEVLHGVSIHQDAQDLFAKAAILFDNAKSGPDPDRLQSIDIARQKYLEAARQAMQN